MRHSLPLLNMTSFRAGNFTALRREFASCDLSAPVTSKNGEDSMSLPQVVSPRNGWCSQGTAGKEKEMTRQRDNLNADRRRLPMVELDKD